MLIISRVSNLLQKVPRSRSENKYGCEKWGKIFSSSSSLKTHMILHTGNFRWYCEQCKKGFAQKAPYNSHMRAHEGLKYRCEYCGKSFTEQIKLKYHMSKHTGIYKFKCDICDMGFNLFPQYEKHVLMHNPQQ